MSDNQYEYQLPKDLEQGLTNALRNDEQVVVKKSSRRNVELMIAPYRSIKGANIHMCLRESNHQRPHVHVEYGDQEVSIDIENQEILAGKIPPKQLKEATNYIRKNKDKFHRYWESMKQGKNPKIEEANRVRRLKTQHPTDDQSGGLEESSTTPPRS